MKNTLSKPAKSKFATAMYFNLTTTIKGWFTRQEPRPEKQNMDSIFSLACQRCAGFTTRPRARQEDNY